MTEHNYRLLSRKYRPSNLMELRGQDVLVKALSYAISHNKLAQSYLLTGIRGIGKTTTARIIAKTINCQSLKIIDNIPLSCEQCSNCLGANNFNHPDIIEIDAASRTGVEDVRVIIENAEYKPLLGRYKVFIIDEVHMLSKNAFNALLKLLEEPAAHTLFIFATTEVHKIPLTIISRCQRFDLARFSKENLEKLLEYISKLENLNSSPAAIKILAVKADGSARDALSLLDQATILAGNLEDKLISKELVNNMISAVDQNLVINFLNKIIEANSEDALKFLEEFHLTQADFHFYVSELLSVLAYIAKKLAIHNYKLEEFFSHEEQIDNIASKMDIKFTQIAWQLCYKAQEELKNSSNQLQYMQMFALKLTYIRSTKTTGLSSPNLEHPNHNSTNTQTLNSSPKNFASDSIPTISSTNLSLDKKKLNFDDFLKYLFENNEMELYYHLFNKAELVELTEEFLSLKAAKANFKFDQQLKEKISHWSTIKIEIKIEYCQDFTPYKEKLKDQIINHSTIQKLAKTFSDLQITDILMQSNSK